MRLESRVAIFLDAENVAHWVKQDGLTTLLEELTSIGTVVVRKAYARWTNTSMEVHQATLNRHGFELIHTFHPVSGKNSADIQITVDVMQYAARDDIGCIALATGDSDFSPLFRRLREMGKQVVGVGPRSALSESVKSSCSRFVYTESDTPSSRRDEAARASAFDDAADLLEAALKTFDGAANCSALKNRMLNIDSAFDEKSLGFKSFTAFVKAVDGVGLAQDDKTWSAFFVDSGGNGQTRSGLSAQAIRDDQRVDPTEEYRRLLRKKQWRRVPAPILKLAFSKMQTLDALPKADLLETVVTECNGEVTTSDVRKAVALFMKAGLMRVTGKTSAGEASWRIAELTEGDMLRAVDRAMLVRLAVGLDEEGKDLEISHLRPLFLRQCSNEEVQALLTEARALARKNDGAD